VKGLDWDAKTPRGSVGTAILHRATAFSHLHASNSGIYYPGPIHDSTESVYEISDTQTNLCASIVI
jgi:hypothetical protein